MPHSFSKWGKVYNMVFFNPGSGVNFLGGGSLLCLMIPLSKVCGDIGICWGGNASKKGIGNGWNVLWKKLEGIGFPQQDFGIMYTDLLIKKLHHVLDDVSHPLHDCLSGQLIARSGRMRLPSAVTGWYLSSFVPRAMWHHNANYKRGDVSAWCFSLNCS